MNNEKSDKNMLVLLEAIILIQLLLENLEELQGTHYNKQRLKQQMNYLIKELEPLAERDYNVVFNNGQEETIKIANEYSKMVKFISLQKLPSKVALTQIVEAWNIDHEIIEATVHRINNKKKNANK
jgi:hypothetical protein